MDSRTSDQLTKTKTLRPPEGSLLRRDRIESVLTEADQALAGSDAPAAQEEPEARSYVGTEEPLRAPKTQADEVSSTSTNTQDGFIPDDDSAVKEQLQARVFSVLRTEVSHVLPGRAEERPARITYRFDTPVTGAKGEVMGRLLAFGAGEELVEFGPGQKVRRVVQVVEAEDLEGSIPTKTETLEAAIGAAGIAQWEKADPE